MTEFEELALKKITKEFLIDSVYARLNRILGLYDISNSEISKQIGWDPAGFNQKYSRSNDLRITTFVKIYVALTDLIAAKESELGLDETSISNISLDELITRNELEVGALFNHISAAVEGKTEFLNKENYINTYKRMKPFVVIGKKSKKFSDREIAVYTSYYKMLSETS